MAETAGNFNPGSPEARRLLGRMPNFGQRYVDHMADLYTRGPRDDLYVQADVSMMHDFLVDVDTLVDSRAAEMCSSVERAGGSLTHREAVSLAAAEVAIELVAIDQACRVAEEEVLAG